MPVRSVKKKEDKIIEEEVARQLATVQRTVVQSIQIPVEEYEQLYGEKAEVTGQIRQEKQEIVDKGEWKREIRRKSYATL